VNKIAFYLALVAIAIGPWYVIRNIQAADERARIEAEEFVREFSCSFVPETCLDWTYRDWTYRPPREQDGPMPPWADDLAILGGPVVALALYLWANQPLKETESDIRGNE
jgi:peptidoglycan/LPS O-acetylase OafA/YrhL